jgi:hypothetical protein
MARTKKPISFAEQFAERVSSMTNLDNHFSTDINKILDRYFLMIDRNYPDFTTNEWKLCFNAMNGYPCDDNQRHVLSSSIANIVESCDYDNSHEQFTVDKDSFFKKLQGLTDSEKFAMLDMSERFWASKGTFDDCDGYEEIVARLKGQKKNFIDKLS